MNNLFFLKQIGHDLLEEYISLDLNKNKKFAKKKAYDYLGKKLRKEYTAHFSMMTTEQEVLKANNILRNMIGERRRKMERESKIQIAPNLRELQRSANELNRDILMA